MSILRMKEVCQIVGLSRVSLWRLEKAGDFPARIQLGPRSVGWPASEIEDWLASRQHGINSEMRPKAGYVK